MCKHIIKNIKNKKNRKEETNGSIIKEREDAFTFRKATTLTVEF